MARTASSLASPSVTSAISPHMARLTALRILGRLNTTVAMPPSRSTRISSLIPLPLCASPRSPNAALGEARVDPLLRVAPGKDSLAEPSANFNSPLRKALGADLYLRGYSGHGCRFCRTTVALPARRNSRCRHPRADAHAAGGAGRAGMAGVLLAEPRRHQGRRGCPRGGPGDRAGPGVLLHLGPDC